MSWHELSQLAAQTVNKTAWSADEIKTNPSNATWTCRYEDKLLIHYAFCMLSGHIAFFAFLSYVFRGLFPLVQLFSSVLFGKTSTDCQLTNSHAQILAD
jgi:hypothetical protein